MVVDHSNTMGGRWRGGGGGEGKEGGKEGGKDEGRGGKDGGRRVRRMEEGG